MKQIYRAASAAVLFTGLVASSLAADQPTPEDAKAMVKSAIAYYQKNGADKTIAAINGKDPLFFQGTLYIAANDTNGVALAHPLSAKMIGKNMADLKDSDGKPFVQDMIKIAKSGQPGWVDYRWPNPETKEIQGKTTYVESTPDKKMYFNAGVYKPK